MLQLCILLLCCGMFFCNLPNLCLRTFHVGTALISPSFPICCCWRCQVTCQLLCTVHDVSSVDGKKIGSCGQCSIPSGFDKAQNLSDQWLFLHAQRSQFSLLHNVVCFVPHVLLVLFVQRDFQRCQIGCSCFADDCFCVFPICLRGYPDSIVPTELSIQYLHLLRHSWFVSKFCSVDFQLRL